MLCRLWLWDDVLLGPDGSGFAQREVVSVARQVAYPFGEGEGVAWLTNFNPASAFLIFER